MRIAFVYDIRENVLGVTNSDTLRELTTEFFTPNEANAIIRELKALGHEIVVLDGLQGFRQTLSSRAFDFDLVFNEAKGLYGPERKLYLPALCDVHEIKYVGSTGYVVSLARNKWHSRAVAAQAGVAVAPGMFVNSLTELDRHWSNYPAFVKPNFESASIGISKNSLVRSLEELEKQTAQLLQRFPEGILVEAFVTGREMQVSLLGNRSPRALPPAEVTIIGNSCMGDRFITNEAWGRESVEFHPCSDDGLRVRLKEAAIKIYRACGLRHYGRVDFRVPEDGQPVFIEVATHPHITPGSSMVASASWAGMTHGNLLDTLLCEALAVG